MNGPPEFVRIAKPELLRRLAGGQGEAITVVTPNQRLAAALARDFDTSQSALGLAAWEAADILPFPVLVRRMYEDALHSEVGAELPALLSDAEEQALWDDVVRAWSEQEGRSKLLLAPGAAALARDAWRTAHAWQLTARLEAFRANDDARSFVEWARTFERITRQGLRCDQARLADIVIRHLGHGSIRKPASLVAYGFDILSPQPRGFLASLGAAGVRLLCCGPEARAAQVRRIALASAEQEIDAAARWARSRLEENPDARIGVVVPDLARLGRKVRRIFAQVMDPGHLLPGAGGKPLPFNVSLGEPLSSYPLIAAAQLVFDLARDEIEFSKASRLIRSPFVAGAQTEFAARARFDAWLRERSGTKTGLSFLRRMAAAFAARPRGSEESGAGCAVLSRCLGRLGSLADRELRGARSPAEWSKVLSALLDAIGFPGERSLDSVEYQTLEKFQEALAAFAGLDRVAGRMRFAAACARLKQITDDTLFQPEAQQAPIQVLGVLESAGLEFDHLWVMGLSDQAWPLPARPNPFIPVALQRAAGVPEASASSSLELDERITQGWLGAAAEVVLSHALREKDWDLVPSPLIARLEQVQPEALGLTDYLRLRRALWRAARIESLDEGLAPPLAGAGARTGGATLFRDQAACPFRAFAVHRLGAEQLRAPCYGPDAAERGTLVHSMLARVWQELRSQERLETTPDEELEALLERAAAHAVDRQRQRRPEALEGPLRELEAARLVDLARAWLDVERARPPFEVAAIEQERAVSFGGVTVGARADRIDRIRGAGDAILDYKTGEASPAGWLGARPDDPQLPMYALAAGAQVCAVAFARVKAGQLGFRGVSRDGGVIPGVGAIDAQRSRAARQYASWEDLLASWRAELEALGSEFAAGEARVDPKRRGETCRNCGLQPLCRIGERLPAALAGDGEEGSPAPGLRSAALEDPHR